ncbi:MAG: DUF2569 domain-containing protein [Candidatus Delongbacteria bacterium]|nr:DUF2569 domain-containing protein [Candidatus Delongbacteria bacterium]
MENNKNLKGLSGWLILVGIGVVLSPIRLLVTTVSVFQPIFTDGTWEALTTVGSEVYNPLWGPLLIGEVLYNLCMVLASTYLIYLFFSKHHRFPSFYIAIFAVSLIFIPLDAWLISFVMPGEPMFDPDTAKEYGRVLVVGLIWVPYMLKSKRVKVTFVEKMPNSKSINADN